MRPFSGLTCNYPRRRLSLTTSLAGAWARTIGVTILQATTPSSVSLLASMRQNRLPSTQTSSVSVSMPCMMPFIGGMNMAKRLYLLNNVYYHSSFNKVFVFLQNKENKEILYEIFI